MNIQQINWGSPEYERMIELRVTALLVPIGIPASYINPANEKNDLFIAALETEEMVGCCILTPRDKDLVQLRQMAVRPDYQGKRIGAAILDFAEKLARKNGFNRLMMHARDPVLDFYRKCGYEIVGKQFFEVGMGHHLMEKKLDN